MCHFVWSVAFSLILLMSVLSNNIVCVLLSPFFTIALLDRTEGGGGIGGIALAFAASGG